MQKKLHQPLLQRHKLKCLGASKASQVSGSSHLDYFEKLNYSRKWLTWVAALVRKDKTKGASTLGKTSGENQRHSSRQNAKLSAQKCFLRAVFGIWTWFDRPSAITPSLPLAKGSTHSWPKHRVTPGQLSSFPDRPCPSWVRGVHPDRQKTVPERKKTELPCLDLLCSIPSCCSYRRFVHGEGGLSGTTPADVREGDPAQGITAVKEQKTPDRSTQRTPLVSPQAWFSKGS